MKLMRLGGGIMFYWPTRWSNVYFHLMPGPKSGDLARWVRNMFYSCTRSRGS